VEDNPANLALVEQLIARRGDLKLLTAIDAHLGIELARAYLPDVILMDINLPGMSGYGALKRLHEDPVTAHIPVLALSANAVPRDIEKGLEAGFFRYLTKPIRVHEFMNALDVALLHAARSSLHRRTPPMAGIPMPRFRGTAMLEANEILNASILIVDDQEANVMLLEQMLRNEGYRQHHDHPGSARGLRLHQEQRFDLILLDLQMPEMDGFEVIEALKAIEHGSYLPVLVITAQPAHKLRALKGGREGFRQQAIRLCRSTDAHPQHARGAPAVPPARRPQPRARADGARAHRRAARERSTLPALYRTVVRLVLGAGRLQAS
jgi:CheY-like chemotaxis protein